jgi:hypothetical protein
MTDKPMLIIHTPSAKELYFQKQYATQQAMNKINKEFAQIQKPSDGAYFDMDKMVCILRVIFAGGITKKAYKSVREEYKVDKTFTQKASKRHSSKAFKQALDFYKSTPMANLLLKNHMFTKGYQKLYYEEVVSTGLARLARNIEILSERENLQKTVRNLLARNEILDKKVQELEAKLSTSKSDWFKDIALPMKLNGSSIADIAIATGQKKDTISKRLRREVTDNVQL